MFKAAGKAELGNIEKGEMPVITSTIYTPELKDERLTRTSLIKRMLRRPEVGALAAALIVFVFFSFMAPPFIALNGVMVWLFSASTFGIMAVAVAMLMIGGEFDLSAGVITGSTGLIVGATTTALGWNIYVALTVSFIFAFGIGIFNGFLTMLTRLPSFIVTLGTMFILAGLNLAATRLITGQVTIQNFNTIPGYDSLKMVFGGAIPFFGAQLKVSVIWWIALTVLVSYVLLRTRFGNWTFAVGGQFNSARQVGVPVMFTKVSLFIFTSLCGWLTGMIALFDVGTVQASSGVGQEFIYIICAVVGGCMLTGGYGSAIGAGFGALIYGMALQGIVFAQWDSNWLSAFLGVILLLAVLMNKYVRRSAGGRD